MRSTILRLAESITAGTLKLQDSGSLLLPPKSLYRSLLRAHRRLPTEMRSMGDDYVKAEFRRHRKVTNPVHVIGFLSQWKLYLDQLPREPDMKNFSGKRIDSAQLEKMSGEQLGQLYELKNATKDAWKPAESEEKAKK